MTSLEAMVDIEKILWGWECRDVRGVGARGS